MKIQKYQKNLSSQLYHFESSDMYCEKEDIIQARNQAINSSKWSENELSQLNKIIEMELLRYRLAMNKLSLERYQKIVATEVDTFYQKWHIHIFQDTKVSEAFYTFLNEEFP